MKINVRKIKSIKLFGKTFSVKFADGEDWSMDGGTERYLGRCDHGNQVILIKDRLSNESCMDTLFHEIAHIVSIELGMDLPEDRVTQWATALTNLFLSNEWKT